MKKIIIIQRILPHYRVEIFRQLQEILENNGVKLVLIYGQENKGAVPVSVDIDEDWAFKIKNKYIRIFGREFVWQPCIQYINGANLIIIEQAGRLIINYLLQFVLMRKYEKLAYWGHGRNMQGSQNSIREIIKLKLLNNIDWWFLYTDINLKHLIKYGVPDSKISIVNNSINTNELNSAVNELSNKNKLELKSELGLTSKYVVLYCGGMYPDKKLSFLLQSCMKIKKNIKDFEIILIGSGPDEVLVKKYCNEYKWIKYIGPKFGKERVPYFMASDLLLMPGLVGLAIIDSFITQTPIVTTNISSHSPEIAYLENGKNGIMTDYSLDKYSDAVVDFLLSDTLQLKLAEGCQESAKKYTIDLMVGKFSEGVVQCLD